MSAFFWTLLGANGVFAVLIFAALPWGPDLLYAIQAGSLLGAVFMLGWKERARQREWDSPPKEWDHSP